MCNPIVIPLISAAAGIGGTVLSARASSQQASAAATARLQEVKRQGSIMQDQMRIQDQQRQDALQSRKVFQDQTLDAYTPNKLASDTAAQQGGLSSALAAAGDRAAAPLAADATRTSGTVKVNNGSQGQDSQAAASSAYDQALASQLAHASGINTQQSGAQAAMQALTQARIAGNQRLQDSANAIQLAGARNQALNRPLSANNLLSNASSQYYAGQQDDVMNKGAGAALAGQALTTLGSIGYQAGSSGMFKTLGAPKAIVVPSQY
jgi:hypothetical protein